jgi:hypothetical protein
MSLTINISLIWAVFYFWEMRGYGQTGYVCSNRGAQQMFYHQHNNRLLQHKPDNQPRASADLSVSNYNCYNCIVPFLLDRGGDGQNPEE